MNSLRVAIIGCGKQASKHISGLRQIPGVEIVLMDRDQKLAKRLAEQNGLSWYPDLDAVLADDAVKVLDICTPTSSHGELIRAGVSTGRDFLCEKPLCESLEEAKELANLVGKSGQIGMIGYIYRFAPIFELGKSLFDQISETGRSLALGNVVTATFRLGGRGDHQLWKHQRDQGGGAINEILVHMVDLAIWYFGPVLNTEVLACELLRPERHINGELSPVDAEDYVLVRLTMDSGITVFCQADLVTPAFNQYVEVQGTNGTFMGSIQPDMPSYLYCDQPVAGYEAMKKTVFNFGERNLFEAQMADFISSVRAGRQPSRSTIADSVLLMEAMDKIKRELGR